MSDKKKEAGNQSSRRSLLRRGLALSSGALASRWLGRRPLGAQPAAAGASAATDLPRADLVPGRSDILAWIEEIFAGGVRRPAYEADRRAEELCLERFRDLGLDNVRSEPVELPHWEPRAWSLVARSAGRELEIPCFPLPHSAPTEGVESELVAYDSDAPEKVRGKIALDTNSLLHLPARFPTAGLPAGSEDPELAIRLQASGRVYDPERTLDAAVQILPFGPRVQGVLEPTIAAGAIGFVGELAGYPGDSCEYYVPYDAIERPIPAVWIRGSDGSRLRALLAAGPVQVKLTVDSARRTVTSSNLVGELAGADEEVVVIGSHHDGPWSSAVEDASGTAMVWAQAAYWAAVPAAERPHRLVFLVNAGHMAGGAGCRSFLERHAAELERIVLEVHLEHLAREIVERDGELAPSGQPEPRWWFTSRIPQLENAVWGAIEAEDVRRSLVIPPDVFGPLPTTDGGAFHLRGVPLVNFLCAPFYLFDAMDTIDKIDVDGLEPVTRAAIRIVHSTRGVGAAAMRRARRG